jgi:hypothetical protein
MAKKAKPPNPCAGRWRITWIDQWDQDFVDAEVEGFFEFGSDNLGSFQFGYVKGDIDHRVTERDGKLSVEFSFEGHDEMDPSLGRGWAVVNGEEIDGLIVFHRGDESKFKARRVKRK